MINKIKNNQHTDIHMPAMNGYRSTRWLRKHCPEMDILARSGMEAPQASTEIIE
ncbi:hypothetical protein [Parapedobacter sp. 10938]|uniref:hypothetical protein n=1 Tax=Parapedobacter flavus TaxID=3110225 RepID=UPI002DB7AF66|nr:hypothetical protein [Parapedobacter sp. 10938]MEC3878623.1 hypothetical protein [Parapedobacter sp. 10938]